MQGFFRIFIIVLAVVALTPAAYAQEVDNQTPSPIIGAPIIAPPLIGIVDMGWTMQNSQAIMRIRQAIDEQNTVFQTEIAIEEIALRDAERALNEAQNQIPAEEFEQKRAEFQTRVIAHQQKIQAQQTGFDRAYAEAQERLEAELLTIIGEITQERGFAVVIQRQDAVVYDSRLDISQEALMRLNERTGNITVTFGRIDNAG